MRQTVALDSGSGYRGGELNKGAVTRSDVGTGVRRPGGYGLDYTNFQSQAFLLFIFSIQPRPKCGHYRPIV